MTTCLMDQSSEVPYPGAILRHRDRVNAPVRISRDGMVGHTSVVLAVWRSLVTAVGN